MTKEIIKIKSIEDILIDRINESAVQEFNGIRFIKGFINNTIIRYDDIERYDGSGRYKKGIPKDHEIERFKEDFNIDVSNMKKSDFPISYNYKTKKIENIKFVKEDLYLLNYELSIFQAKSGTRGFLYVFFWNDSESFQINKEDISKFEELSKQDFNNLINLI